MAVLRLNCGGKAVQRALKHGQSGEQGVGRCLRPQLTGWTRGERSREKGRERRREKDEGWGEETREEKGEE